MAGGSSYIQGYLVFEQIWKITGGKKSHLVISYLSKMSASSGEVQ